MVTIVKADELFKFLALRNSLTGIARLLLTKGPVTYEELKANLLKEFGHSVSRQEIYKVLQHRRKKSDETVQRFILEMEAIARGSDVSEYELVAFVLHGLQDRTIEYAIFCNAKSITDLKEAANMAEHRNAVRRQSPNIQSYNKNKVPIEISAVNNRCYNCSKFGHLKYDCPYEVRSKGVCFNCWKLGHDHKACTNPKYVQRLKKTVATVMQTNDVQSGNFINFVHEEAP
ncbi:uncharacterized protein [Eurosta solidaginis]|uniref:uncharacterized protein n=1 Tax=Eurosta solidaginis TaxID=178769 RepID=UPI0035310D5E